MADSISVDFGDLEKTAALMEGSSPRIAANAMRATVHAMAGEIRNNARQEAPKDTKRLSKSIRSKRVKTQYTGEFGSDVTISTFYWFMIEYGTKFINRNPFVQRAVDRWLPTAAQSLRTNFGKKLEAGMRREAKRLGIER